MQTPTRDQFLYVMRELFGEGFTLHRGVVATCPPNTRPYHMRRVMALPRIDAVDIADPFPKEQTLEAPVWSIQDFLDLGILRAVNVSVPKGEHRYTISVALTREFERKWLHQSITDLCVGHQQRSNDMSIQAALRELADELLAADCDYAESHAEDFVSIVASEYDLNAALLSRKFEEQFGCEPWQYPRREADRAASLDARANAEREAIQDAARRDALLCVNNNDALGGIAGAAFTYREDTYYWAGVDATRRRWRAVRSDNGKAYLFTNDQWSRAMAQNPAFAEKLLEAVAQFK